MTDLYVYYKVRDEHAERLASLVRAFQTRMIQAGAARLLRRPESRDGLQTWMEVYPGVPESFAGELETAALGAGFAGLIEGPRRVEVFVEFPPCA